MLVFRINSRNLSELMPLLACSLDLRLLFVLILGSFSAFMTLQYQDEVEASVKEFFALKNKN